ncbi:MAG: fasciclin domain-containing protein [Krumholzibacteria bacterium]|nr:fasciclin domain-containing protein [Candidatus Krumholzibacteria bacterium]
MKKLMITALVLVAAFALAGCSDDNNPTAVTGAEKARPSERTTIVDVALAVNAETGEFSTLIAAVVAADLVDALSARGQLTVFAPTDAAFAKLGLDADSIGSLDKDTLTGILLYHVAKGRRLAEDVVSSDRIRMLNGGFTAISLNDEGAFINDALIVATDVPADNGVIHVIDTVLLP